ncbi:efflux RND transporter periplasmic adaptor subunit [Hymenobacter taeanensis]|uniref:Efflux RND transporter periplasmic adaptor subunit n=1 Tax=Hymenobacter taeanensis TaxID=2735321 RepID=A0A6M6BNQ5_9BACT|nr:MULTISPECIES: efflux RND transporter periplasmic adaptor subunit [Hymenobacter]QJX48665.1 efflux RND transporter periplasmic adaptor subunit [Hymenobacter taeanensis]UOQ81836.1 efflux RND transporter periplasmic adaptor subunit [Hymenobacter sp. 5414T-23]
MKNNRVLYILLGIVVLLLVGYIVAKKQGLIGKPAGTEVLAVKASPNTIVETVSASGKVQPETEVKISPDVSGEIIELNVEEGDSVKKGQLLLRIRPDNYQAMVNMQTASVGTQRANVAQTQARLQQLLANAKQTELTYRRNASLYKQKVISQADFEASKAAYEASQEEINSARQSIRAAQSNVQSAQASLDEARKNLDKTTIYAPVSGTVSKLNVKKGERVVGTSQMAGTEIMRIANLNNMEVRVSVNENDIINVSLGDSADVEVDSYASKNQKFRGVVTSIANTAKDALTAEAVTEFEVRIRLLPASYQQLLRSEKGRAVVPFRPGMTASVDIITERKANVLSVPLMAVTTRSDSATTSAEGKGTPAVRVSRGGAGTSAADQTSVNEEPVEQVVFLIRNGKAVMTPVKTGISDRNNMEVLSGIQAGDQLVSGPYRAVSKTLKDGAPVVIKDLKSLDKSALKEDQEEEN